MRKILTFLVLSGLLCTSVVYADSDAKARKRCYTGHKKYVAIAKIKESGFLWTNDNERLCSGKATGFISAQDYDCNNNLVVAAEASAEASKSKTRHYSYIGSCTGYNAGYTGTNVNIYGIRFHPSLMKRPSGGWGTKASLEIDSIDFDSLENMIRVKISLGQIRMYQDNNNDYYAAITIKLQDLSSDLDDETSGTVYEDVRIIWKEGVILKTSHFNGNYSIGNSGEDIICEISDFEIEFDLANYSGISDINNVEIQIITDVGETANGIPAFVDLTWRGSSRYSKLF